MPRRSNKILLPVNFLPTTPLTHPQDRCVEGAVGVDDHAHFVGVFRLEGHATTSTTTILCSDPPCSVHSLAALIAARNVRCLEHTVSTPAQSHIVHHSCII